MGRTSAKEKKRLLRAALTDLYKTPKKWRFYKELMRIGHETKSQKEARQRRFRFSQFPCKSRVEKEAAEKQRLIRVKNLTDRMNATVRVSALNRIEGKPLYFTETLTRKQMCDCLEHMSDLVTGERKNRNGTTKLQRTINLIDKKELEEKIRIFKIIKHPENGEISSLAESLKAKVKKIFSDPRVLDVIEGDEYGFKFNTKEALSALSRYYSIPLPDGYQDTLTIRIKDLVKGCWYEDRFLDRGSMFTPAIKYAVLDETHFIK